MDKLIKIVEVLGKILDAANMIHAALSGITQNFRTVKTAPAPAPVVEPTTEPAE